jgi:hypothetical protein
MTEAEIAALPVYGGRDVPTKDIHWVRVIYCFGHCRICRGELDGVEAIAFRDDWEALCHTREIYHCACVHLTLLSL